MNNENKTIRLMLGYLCLATEPEASLVRQVEILDRFNLTNKEISIICGCSERAVSYKKEEIKKGKSGRKTKNS